MSQNTESVDRSQDHNISHNSAPSVTQRNASRDTTNITMSSSNVEYKDMNGSGNCDLTCFGLVKKGLRIGNLNVCHIMPKLDEIQLLLHDNRSVNILGLCETFLNDNIDDSILSIDGFNFERRDRNGQLGGGILVYISNQIAYKTSIRFRNWRWNRNNLVRTGLSKQ